MDGRTPRKKTRLRRLAQGLFVLSVGFAVAVAALPWLFSTATARDAIVKKINQALAPSKVGIGGLSLSWLGPIRLSGLSLTDGHGKTIVTAKRAVLNRGLIPLMRDHSRLGTITLDGAVVDVERRPDGSIDLIEALSPSKPADAPVSAASPKRASARPLDVTLKVARGSLVLKTPELAEPIRADEMAMEVRYPAAPGKKLTWRIRLAKPPGGATSDTLGIDGEYDHRGASDPDLSLHVKGDGRGWPIAVAGSGVVVKARLVGSLTAARGSGAWETSGDAKLLGLDANGPALSGDRLAFDSCAAVWDVAQSGGAWSLKNLGIVSPVGTLSGRASVAADGGSIPEARVEGRIDLAALARQLPHALRLREGLTLEHGSARVVVEVKSSAGAETGTLEANVSDLVARDPSHAFTLRDPAAISAQVTRTASGVSIKALNVKTAFLDLTGSGDMDKGVRLNGTIDLGGVQSQFKELIDFGAVTLAGKGAIAADYRKTGKGAAYLARYAAEVRGLKVAGLTNAPIVRDSLRLDAAVSGSASPNGAPANWESLRANAIAGPDKVTVAGRLRNGVTALTGSASLPVTVSSRDGRADVAFAGRLKPGSDGALGVVEFDECRATLRPLDPALASSGTIALAARGSIDLVNDDVALSPLPLPAGTPLVVSVGPEGLKYHGLRKTAFTQKAAKGVLVGDLAAIERALFVWTGREPGGYGGALRAQIGMGAGENRLNVGLTVSVPDFSRPTPDGKGRQPEGSVVVAASGGYAPDADRVTFDALTIASRFGRLDATGTLDNPTGSRLAELQGTIAPAWDVVSKLATESVGSPTALQGRPRPFRVKGPLSGASAVALLKGLDAEIALELTSADAFGMKLGPAPIVVRGKGGAYTIDPIETSLNNGRVTLLPGLTVDEVNGIDLSFARGSAINGAEINDQVSKAVLTYVAPVLDRATHVNGKVSVTIDHANFPLVGPDNRRVNILGQLVFQDVVFAPGPFASEMLSLAGRSDSPGVRLHQPVQLSVADGRVIQKGLEIPIRKDAAVALEGSVGFDQTLDMRASLPIFQAMLGGRSGLDKVIGDRRVVVPINGTVSHPKIDKRALQLALRDLSRSVLKKELSGNAADLLNQLVPFPSAGRVGGGGSIDLKALEGELLKRIAPKRR